MCVLRRNITKLSTNATSAHELTVLNAALARFVSWATGGRDARSGRVQGRPRSLHSHLERHGCNNDVIIVVIVVIVVIDVAIDAGIFGSSCKRKLYILRDSIVHMLQPILYSDLS